MLDLVPRRVRAFHAAMTDGQPANATRLGLAVELTGRCNQSCSYCFNSWRADGGRSVGGLPEKELLALIERVLDEVEFDHVSLSGGEPLAHPAFFAVLELLWRRGVRAHVISNGALIGDVAAARLAQHPGVSVQITLNGPNAEEHERATSGGRFERTVAGIRALRERGVRVTGTIVLTRQNADRVGETLDLFRELGVTVIGLARFSPAGYSAEHVAELLPSRSDVLTALHQAHARSASLDLALVMPIPRCVVDPALFPGISFVSCPVGTDHQEFALGPDGKVRHCLLHPAAIGDARTESMAALIAAPAVRHYRDVSPAFCAPCPERSTCVGGCGAAADSVHGDPRALDPFVGQHVDAGFRAKLASARESSPLVSIRRRPPAPA